MVISLNAKQILKTLKLQESNISMVLGAVVLIVVAVMVVNYFKNLNPASVYKTGANTENLETKHTVTAGESLWSISQKYYQDGYKWSEVAKANNLPEPYTIEVGQVLSVPDSKKEVPTFEKEQPSSDSTTESSISGATYTVVKGDDLWNIAVRSYGDGYQWVKIARENNLVKPDLIHSGNVLTIPR